MGSIVESAIYGHYHIHMYIYIIIYGVALKELFRNTLMRKPYDLLYAHNVVTCNNICVYKYVYTYIYIYICMCVHTHMQNLDAYM